jgi:methylaspartate mutase epsilon subunit
VKQVRYLLEKFPVVDPIRSEAIALEEDLIASEADYVLEAICDLPGDVFWESVYQAFRRGFLDVPFAPHHMNPNMLLTARDRHFAIRIKDPGMVPMRPNDVKRERQLLETNSDAYNCFIDKMINDINIQTF